MFGGLGLTRDMRQCSREVLWQVQLVYSYLGWLTTYMDQRIGYLDNVMYSCYLCCNYPALHVAYLDVLADRVRATPLLVEEL